METSTLETRRGMLATDQLRERDRDRADRRDDVTDQRSDHSTESPPESDSTDRAYSSATSITPNDRQYIATVLSPLIGPPSLRYRTFHSRDTRRSSARTDSRDRRGNSLIHLVPEPRPVSDSATTFRAVVGKLPAL